MGVGAPGHCCQLAAGPPVLAAAVDVAEAGGEPPPSLLPRELGLTLWRNRPI
jgi:hypothetical protein